MRDPMSRGVSGLYEFGPFRLDLERRVFTRDDQVLPLAPKTFDLLVLLVQSPGRAFSKQELMNALWPDTFVEEANLSFQVSALRKALGADGARWIETVPKHGYRFSAEVRAITPSGKLPAEPPSGPPNTSSSVTPGRGIRKAWLGGAMIAAALLVIALLTMMRGPGAVAVRPAPAAAVPLTAYPGFEQMQSLSPDGSRVAFSWNGQTQDNYDIYVKVAGPGEPGRLTTSPAADESPAWSPDGRFIAFLRVTSSTAADLMIIPAGGGASFSYLTNQSTEEGFDYINVEISNNGGASFNTLGSFSGVFVGTREFDLAPYAGSSVRIRFRMVSDLVVPDTGTYIEDIRIATNNFATLADVGATPLNFSITGRTTGTRHYRIAGIFSSPDGNVIGPYSNSRCVTVP